jgi:Raf kinase inhibitor-like YbhB/YbcL family protein
MRIESADFKNNGLIPEKFCCDGSDVSPTLTWYGVPRAAKSLALTLDDPDAPVGTWTHWLIYNLPTDAKSLPSGVPLLPTLSHGALQGKNSFHKIGYRGPCPAPGHGAHRYFFRLYALDKMLNLRAGISREKLEDAMRGHILSRAELMGRFERQVVKRKTQLY